MRIRIRRGELALIAATLMFACFIGGYFTGKKGAVNVVAVEPSFSFDQHAPASEPTAGESETAAARAATAGGDIGRRADAADEEADFNDGERHGETEPGRPQESPGALRDSDGKININTASRSELMDLSGIGQTLAGRIVEYRDSHGPFSRIEDLTNVSGIGEKRFEAIKDRITVGS